MLSASEAALLAAAAPFTEVPPPLPVHDRNTADSITAKASTGDKRYDFSFAKVS